MFARLAFGAGLVAALLLGSASAIAATASTESAVGASAQSDLQALVNQYRAANGLRTVSLNGSLSTSATWMAADMAAKNYFSHTSSDGLSPVQRMAGAGYPASVSYTGEDLAAGFPGAAQVLAGWIASPPHNAVLLNPNYDAIGIGVGYSATSTYHWYWAADFAGPAVSAPAVAPAPAAPAAPAPVVAPAPPAAPAPAIPAARTPVSAPSQAAAAGRTAALAATPPDSTGNPAPSEERQAETASDKADPAADLVALERAAAQVRREDALVDQMMRLLVRLERRTGF